MYYVIYLATSNKYQYYVKKVSMQNNYNKIKLVINNFNRNCFLASKQKKYFGY